MPFPLPETQGWVAFPAVWAQGVSESRECGNVCEITVGLGCLSRYGGKVGLPIPLPDVTYTLAGFDIVTMTNIAHVYRGSCS